MTNDEHIEALRKELSEALHLDLTVESIQMHPDEAGVLGIAPGNYTSTDGTTVNVRIITKSDDQE